MKWLEISIQTTEEATEAVAAVFHDLGAGGVVIEEPWLVNAYRRSEAWDFCDIPEADENQPVIVKAYLPNDQQINEKLAAFKQRIDELGAFLNCGKGSVNCREVVEEDWATAWKEHFHPVRIGGRLVVKPTWREYAAGLDDIVIELDPGMAFGTGTHYTTQMCAQFLEDLVRPGDKVADLGTGSGVLAVAAAKLGAAKVVAVDIDPVAVDVARQNVVQNGVDAIVEVRQGDLLSGFCGEKFDLIVANIVADVIIRLAPAAAACLKTSGWFIAGGIIAQRLNDVTSALAECGLILDRVTENEGWVAVVAGPGKERGS